MGLKTSARVVELIQQPGLFHVTRDFERFSEKIRFSDYFNHEVRQVHQRL